MADPPFRDIWSYTHASHLVTSLQADFPNGQLHSASSSRSSRIKFRMFTQATLVLQRIDSLHVIFNDIIRTMGDYEHVKMVRAYEREFYQMLECSDCFALNYLDANNWDIIKREAEKIRQKGKDLISTRGRLLAPLHITSALTIASIKTRIEPRLRRPLEARQAELNLLFDMIRKKFRNEGSVWQSDFFRDWTEAVGAELEHRYSRNPAILLEFASFCTIKEGIVEVSLDPFLVVPTDTRPNPYNDPWARLSTDEKIRGFVNRILTPPDAPPSYENLPVHTARSLSRRVGFRQIAIRPDVKTLGLARDGGYWF